MRRLPWRGLALAALSLLALPAPAAAEFGVRPPTVTVTDAGGGPEQRAGAHPDLLKIDIEFNADSPDPAADGNAKDMTISLPRGLVGDSLAVARCSREQHATVGCDPETQVGTLELILRDSSFSLGSMPIYSSDPGPDGIAAFSFELFLFKGRVLAGMGTDGQTLELRLNELGQGAPLKGLEIELWGVPADHQTGGDIPRRPLLTLPTRCDEDPPEVRLRARSWQQQDVWHEVATPLATPVGCDAMRFDPAFNLRLERPLADAPTGLEAGLTLPQNDDPDGQGAARLRSAEIRLPDGIALSPAGAADREACSEEQAAVGAARASACPDASRIGTVELSTPLLGSPLTGGLHLGPQLADTSYRMFVIGRGQGIDLRLRGLLDLDPDTGRLTARLIELPELPFDRISIGFSGGPRAPLVTPLECGPGSASATLTPYGGGPPATLASAVTIGSLAGGPCAASAPFAPTFLAGVSPARAARSSAFQMTLRRPDGDQSIDRFTLTLPRGVSARLAGVRRCPEALTRAADCPPSSRVGKLAAEVGAGPSPLILEGDAFLTGGYRGAPLGLALRFPGKVGPFDLGTIVVRATLRIDPRSGQLTVASDPLPRILKGVPLRIQTLALDVDRRGFIANPTSCAASSVTAAVTSTSGQVARRSTRFAVAGCRALRFAPRLAVGLTDPAELRRDGRPGVTLRVAAGPREANLRAVDVELPALLDQGLPELAAICSREQARDERCPSGSRVGSAWARTPLLADRLRGSVYLVQPGGDGLPELGVHVSGEGVTLNLKVRTVIEGDTIRAKLVDLPDFPLAKFAMRFASGERSLFVADRSPCRGRRTRRIVVRAALKGQNGATRRSQLPVSAPCGQRR